MSEAGRHPETSPGSWPHSQLDKKSLSQQIYIALKQDILFGRLKFDERVNQEALCKRFGTSRMPVRDALKRLTYDGFLVQLPGDKVAVSRFNRIDLEDTFQVESMIHGLATRRATERASEEEILHLQALNEQMSSALASGETERLAALDREIHYRVNRYARSPKLVAALRAISLDIPRQFLVRFPDEAGRSIKQHGSIILNMTAGNPKEAEAEMITHVRDSGDKLIGALLENGMPLA